MLNFLQPLRGFFKLKDLRRRLIYTALFLAVYRLVSHIPVPGLKLEALQEIFAGSAFLSLLDLFSGGTLANFSIMALGIGPYINSSIIFRLLTMVIPSLEELSKEGEYGQEKIGRYTRLLTLPLCLIQSFGVIMLLRQQSLTIATSPIELIQLVITLTAGTMFLIWLGEQITQYGLGNGISFIIFAGIVGRLPVSFAQTSVTINQTQFSGLLIFLIISLAVVYMVIKTSEAIRPVSIQSARRSSNPALSSSANYLPVRLYQDGFLPIIFAVSLMLVPNMLGSLFANSQQSFLANMSAFFTQNLSPSSLAYNVLYFFLVVIFTYFYTTVVFNPEKIAQDLRQAGSFVPGIRPGPATIQHLNYILNRLTPVGALFLGFIAIFPSIMSSLTGLDNLIVGGTSILIVVSVVLELIRNLDSQLSMHDYDKFLK